MTFSLLATDGHAIGAAVTSSSPAVAARCIHLRPRLGAACSQNLTDPRLGPKLLDALEGGAPPEKALSQVRAGTPGADHRQLMLLDLNGRSAVFSGAQALGVVGERRGVSVVAAGNLLAVAAVIDAIVETFESAAGDLEWRLLVALEAGLAAGGEAGMLHSAGMCVARSVPWCETDLRVDWSDKPIEDLHQLVDIWLPQRDDYLARALRPGDAPSFDV